MEDAQRFNYISEIKPFPSIKIPLKGMYIFKSHIYIYLNLYQSDSLTSFILSMKGIVIEINA